MTRQSFLLPKKILHVFEPKGESVIFIDRPKVLFVELSGNKPLPDASVIRVASEGADLTSVTDINAALAALRSQKPFSIVIANAPDFEFFKACRLFQPKATTILLTDLTMERYSQSMAGEEHILIDQVVANRSPSHWTINELRVTIQKIIRNDFFGIEKYLAPATLVMRSQVTGSADRERLNGSVMQFAEQNRLGQYMSKLVFGITEELLMNCIYDAPVAGGAHHYNETPRTTAITLKPNEYSVLSYGCDGLVFAVSVTDPFGALKKSTLFQYLKKVLRRQDSSNLIDTKQGGAGLGLFKILYSAHSLVCNVSPKKRTEVMALIDIHHQVRDFSRMTRSVGYFYEDIAQAQSTAQAS